MHLSSVTVDQFVHWFCHGDSFNVSTLVHSNSPILSRCEVNTFLYMPLILFIIIYTPIRVIYLFFWKIKKVDSFTPCNWTLFGHLLFPVGLVVIASWQLILHLHSNNWSLVNESPIILITYVNQMVTFTIAILLTVWHRQLSLCTSTSLSILSLYYLVCSTLHFILTFTQQSTFTDDEVYFIYAQFTLSVCNLFAQLFSTSRPTNLMPNENDNVKPTHPEFHASFFSRITLQWVQKLVIHGWRKGTLDPDELYIIQPKFTAQSIFTHINKIWCKQTNKLSPATHCITNGHSKDAKIIRDSKSHEKQGNIFMTLLHGYGGYYFKTIFASLILDICVLLSPIILKMLLQYLEEKESIIQWHGYLLVIALFTINLIESLLLNFFWYRLLNLSVIIRSALVSMIYRKSLKITNASRNKSTIGEIVNLMSVDADRFTNFFRYGETLWSGPIRILASIYFIYQDLGVSVFAGVAVMIILIPASTFISRYMQKIQTSQMKKKDERIKLINEILSGIKVIKLYAWEKSFTSLVYNIRSIELTRLRKMAYCEAVTAFLFTSTPMLVAIVTFVTYTLIDSSHKLNAQKAFVSLAYFNIMRLPLTNVPSMFIQTVMVFVSVKRINKFLNLPEVKQYITHENDEFVVRVNGCHFVHENIDENNGEEKKVKKEKSDKSINESDKIKENITPFALKNINMKIKKGSLVAIVGTVGSGKSSLVSALLGEMEKTSGSINIAPDFDTGNVTSIAYVPQQAWIQNDTVKNNILFGEEFDGEKYQKIISACQLTPDLKILPSGDATEIGEKGINLSGGQKQRLSLARACYVDAQMYILDDPLSAVDAHVAKNLYNQVIRTKTGLLGAKTRILVTNDLTLLPKVDYIYVISDGTISESGKYDQLMSSHGKFCHFVEEFANKERTVSSVSENDVRSISRSASEASEGKDRIIGINNVDNSGKLIEDEVLKTGQVNLSVYIYYVKKISLVTVFIIFILSMQSFEAFANWWLSLWASDGDNTTPQLTILRLSVYSCLGIGQVISIVIASLVYARGSIKCAGKMHSSLLDGIIRAPMSFFDTTPIGRIVNRFSKDIDIIDESLPNYFFYWFQILVQCIAIFCVIISVTPWFTLLIVPISIIYYFIQKIYIPTNRQLRRIQSVTRSPVYSNFSETLTGISSIRAYAAQNRFIINSDVKLDRTQRASFCATFTECWLSIRLRLIGNFIIAFTAVFAVLDPSSISPSLAGLAITYASFITDMLTWLVMISAALENDIVAVERVLEYNQLKPEADWESKCIEDKPPVEWPVNGSIEFKSYSTRYRDNLQLVLKDIVLYINGGEHIGIVGRTGAGKSSITLALFRLIEPASGTILIDGVDISKIGLHELREAITIIPQDPVLFSGQLRTNLDPFNKFTDQQLWHSLELAHLKDFVQGLEGGLDYSISEGGCNLSVGQRQLICLARALLKKTKILILDEATAAVDLQTDSLIQSTVRAEFADCTILTIAHRLNTILDSDRILVLERGQVAEFASPKKLLNDTESKLYSLAKDAGIV